MIDTPLQNSQNSALQKFAIFTDSILGGLTIVMLLLATIEMLLAIIGSCEILLVKMGWLDSHQLLGFIKTLRTQPDSMKSISIIIIVGCVIGLVGGGAYYLLKSPTEAWFYSWLTSIKVGISFLAISALISISGTVYELNDAIIVVFDTWWFRVGLIVLMANIGASTWRNVVNRILPTLNPRPVTTEGYYKSNKTATSIKFNGSLDDLNKILKSTLFKVVAQNEFIAGRKGNLKRFGAVIAHIGFITIIICGFCVGIINHEGVIQLAEGDKTEKYQLSLGKTDQIRAINSKSLNKHLKILNLGFMVRCLDFENDFHPQTQIPSKYTTTLEIIDGDQRFVDIVEVNKSIKYKGFKFHQNSFGDVPNQRRHLVSLNDTQTKVNQTYELDVGSEISPPGTSTKLRLNKSQNRMYTELYQGDTILARTFFSKGTKEQLTLKVERFVPDFTMDATRKIITKSNKPNNPALELSISSPGQKPQKLWLFQRAELRGFTHSKHEQYDFIFTSYLKGTQAPDRFVIEVRDLKSKEKIAQLALKLNELGNMGSSKITNTASVFPEIKSDQYTIKYAGTVPKQYTVLTVSRNPMLGLIYASCILMMSGIFIAFFIPMRDVMLWFQADKGMVKLIAINRTGPQEMTWDIKKLIEKIENFDNSGGSKKPIVEPATEDLETSKG